MNRDFGIVSALIFFVGWQLVQRKLLKGGHSADSADSIIFSNIPPLSMQEEGIWQSKSCHGFVFPIFCFQYVQIRTKERVLKYTPDLALQTTTCCRATHLATDTQQDSCCPHWAAQESEECAYAVVPLHSPDSNLRTCQLQKSLVYFPSAVLIFRHEIIDHEKQREWSRHTSWWKQVSLGCLQRTGMARSPVWHGLQLSLPAVLLVDPNFFPACIVCIFE